MRIFLFTAFLTSTMFATAQDSKLLLDFESDADLKLWDFAQKSGSIVAEHATHGQKCLKIASTEHMFWYRVPKDWSAYDTMEIDVFVEGDEPVGGHVLIGDEAWKAKENGTYWNRHNGTFNLKPGANTVTISVNGLFRGEAGSRNADIKTNIDPKTIVRFDIGFEKKGAPTSLFLDNMRFVKESRPDGILAFDFGPASQAVFPGFTAITWNTVHGKDGVKAGLKHPKWGPNAARDDTFPTRLYQDAVNMGGDVFVADVPPGKYHVWVVFDDLGYWGGEQAHFSKRSIESDGKIVWSEDRGPDGFSDYLYRFEKIEPKPGDSMWDLYVKQLVEPKRFEVNVAGGPLELKFNEDGNFGNRVAALIIYPDTQKADAEKWVAEIEDRNRSEFVTRALFMGPRKLQSTVDPRDVIVPEVPEDFRFCFPSLDQEISYYDDWFEKPKNELKRTGVLGQRISFTFAVHTAKIAINAKTNASLSITELKGPQGAIPKSNIDLRYVHNAVHRGYNDIAYSIRPESLRRVEGSALKLPGGSARQFWITVNIPIDTKPGIYSCELSLSTEKLNLKLPLFLEVLDFTLDEPDFLMGFYGTHVPGEIPKEKRAAALRDLLRVQKEYGMTAISGGPSIRLSGFDAAGKPQLDFAACDEYMKAAREAGFTKAIIAYGGPGMVEGLQDGYVVGENARGWEKKLGKPFGEILKTVWTAVKEHADKENWLPILYEMCDEPRVIEDARKLVEMMKLYRENAPWVKIGGSYSVKWNEDPLEKEIQNIFKTLVWSALNEHNQTDLDKAKEFGRELHMYNQGHSRFSFGAYQWAQFHKGVKSRMEWHLLALHGYQFFDLDGREPDSAMINWGRNEVIPTIHLARCREGADDFRAAVTLWNLAQKDKESAAAKSAIAWLEDVSQKIKIGVRERPKDFMDDETFRNTCFEHIQKLK
jgi:hypothetical protein